MATGNVYVLTNETNNAVRVYPRGEDGLLSPPRTCATDGKGGGIGPGGSQGALTLHGQFVFAVNTGDGTVTSFARRPGDDLVRVDREPAGAEGATPVSLVASGDVLYVLCQAGAGPGTVSTMRIGPSGELARFGAALEVGAGPAQVLVSPDGGSVLVMGLSSNTIFVFPVDATGALGAGWSYLVPGVDESLGQPFGATFVGPDLLAVSDPAGVTHAYRFGADRTLTPLPLLPAGSAACWATAAERAETWFAYVTNAAAGTITGYRLTPQGFVVNELVAAALRPANDPADQSGPLDMAVDADQRFVYVLVGGTAGGGMQVRGYAIHDDGRLTRLSRAPVPVPVEVPRGSLGIAAI